MVVRPFPTISNTLLDSPSTKAPTGFRCTSRPFLSGEVRMRVLQRDTSSTCSMPSNSSRARDMNMARMMRRIELTRRVLSSPQMTELSCWQTQQQVSIPFCRKRAFSSGMMSRQCSLRQRLRADSSLKICLCPRQRPTAHSRMALLGQQMANERTNPQPMVRQGFFQKRMDSIRCHIHSKGSSLCVKLKTSSPSRRIQSFPWSYWRLLLRWRLGYLLMANYFSLPIGLLTDLTPTVLHLPFLLIAHLEPVHLSLLLAKTVIWACSVPVSAAMMTSMQDWSIYSQRLCFSKKGQAPWERHANWEVTRVQLPMRNCTRMGPVEGTPPLIFWMSRRTLMRIVHYKRPYITQLPIMAHRLRYRGFQACLPYFNQQRLGFVRMNCKIGIKPAQSRCVLRIYCGMRKKCASLPQQHSTPPHHQQPVSHSRQMRHPLRQPHRTHTHPQQNPLYRSHSIEHASIQGHTPYQQLPLPSHQTDISLPLINVKRPTQPHSVPRHTRTKFHARVKAIHRHSGKVHPSRYFSYAEGSEQGGRVSNEDRVVIEGININGQHYDYLAIFDGHAGPHTAHFLSQHLHVSLAKLLAKHPPPKALSLTLSQADSRLAQHLKMNNKSGSCALVLLVTPGTIWVANVGDSRLLATDLNGNVSQLSEDHKPQVEGQRLRIEQAGGRVYRMSMEEPFRLYPGGLSVSRTIGDLELKKAKTGVLISDPQVLCLDTDKLTRLAMMSDGVYQKLSNQQIMELMSDSAEQGVGRVLGEAALRRSMDNRSIIAFSLK